MVVVSGPLGIGKTRLAEELLESAVGRGLPTVWTSCSSIAEAPPLWVWRSLFERGRELGLPSAEPIIGRAPPDSPGPEESARQRINRTESIERTLRDWSERGPVVVVIDDLQWADEASLETLQHVSGLLRSRRILIVATLRGDSWTSRGLGPLSPGSDELRIGPLTSSDSERLVREVGDGRLTTERVGLIRETGAGNPLNMKTLALANPDLADEEPGAWRRVIVEQQLGRLRSEARRTIEVVALIARFDEDLLAAVLSTTVETVGRSLGELVEAGLLIEADGRYQFGHESVRVGVVETLSLRRQRVCHDRIVVGLERVKGEHPELGIVELAHHAASSVPHGDVKRAQRYLVAAGELAVHQLADEQALRHFEGAIRLGVEHPPGDEGSELTAAVQVGLAQLRLRRVVEAKASLLVAADRAAGLRRFDVVAVAATSMPPGIEGVGTGEPVDPAQERFLALALANLADGDPGRIRSEAASAVAAYWSRDHRSEGDRIALAESALSSARVCGDERTVAYCLNARIAASWGPLGLASRGEDVAELIDLGTRLGDIDVVLDGRAWNVLETLDRWDLQAFTNEVARIDRLTRKLSNPLHRWSVAKWRGTKSLIEGDLRAAEDLAHKARRIARETRVGPYADGMLAGTIGLLRWLQGRSEELIDPLRRMMEQTELPLSWSLGLAQMYAEADDLQSARHHYEAAARNNFADVPHDMTWMTTHVVAADVAIKLDDAPRLQLLRTALEPWRDRVVVMGGGHSVYGPVSLWTGRIDLALDDTRAAADDFRSAVDRAPTGPFGALGRLGLLRLGVGDVVAEDLIAEFRSYGMMGFAAEAAASTPLIPRASHHLVHNGAAWTLRSPSGEVQLRASKGLSHIIALLERPGREVHALQLVGAEGPVVVDGGRPAPVIDGRAIDEYRHRLLIIESSLDEAHARNDLGQAEALQAEFDAITDHLSASLGLRGARNANSDSERARTSVTKAIRRAIRTIGDHDPAVAAHLDANIRTGAYCSYQPDPGISWNVVYEA